MKRFIVSLFVVTLATAVLNANGSGGATFYGNYTSPGGNYSLFDPDDFPTLNGGGATTLGDGTLSIDTSSGWWSYSGTSGSFSQYGAHVVPTGTGETVALFNFEDLTIGSGVAINVFGYNPLVISSRNNLSLASNIALSPGTVGGGNLNFGPGQGYPLHKPTSFAGGGGAGHASFGDSGSGFNSSGSYRNPGGPAYSTPSLNMGLFGGSSGQRVNSPLPGDGGGALGLIAQNTLTLAANLSVGGGVGESASFGSSFGGYQTSAGGGSAGSVLLAAPDIDLTATPTIDIQGGLGGSFLNVPGNFASYGGAGSDGRVAYIHDTETVFGSANILGFGDGGNGTLFNGAGLLPSQMIPEPSRVLLIFLGLSMALFSRRRSRA